MTVMRGGDEGVVTVMRGGDGYQFLQVRLQR